MHYKRRSRRSTKRRLAACGCCEIINPDKLPIEDGPCTGKVKRKKPRKPKEKCPVNRTHEWYKEWVTVEEAYWSYALKGYKLLRREVYKATCIHCWKEKELKRKYPPSDWRIQYRKSFVLPKRPLKF